jgi:predicted amidophosphoribosyltransferase
MRAGIKQLLPAQPCVLCCAMSHDGLWCAACDATLPYFNAPHCPICALPTPGSEVCGHCLTQPPLFSRTTTVFGYSFPLDKLIQGMKYGEQLALAHAFANKLVQRIDRSCLPDYVIAMPLHPAKLRERGFNRTAAQYLSTGTRHTSPIHLAMEGTQEKYAQCIFLQHGPDRETGCSGR